MSKVCVEHGHKYFIAKANYYKHKGNGKNPDQTICYSMLCCSQCGETKEIVSGNLKKSE